MQRHKVGLEIYEISSYNKKGLAKLFRYGTIIKKGVLLRNSFKQ